MLSFPARKNEIGLENRGESEYQRATVNTRDKTILLGSTIFGIALIWTVWALTDSSDSDDASPETAAVDLNVPADPESGSLSPLQARPVQIPPHNSPFAAGQAPGSLENPAASAIAEMQARLQKSAAAESSSGAVKPAGVDLDRPMTRPSKLEEEDNVAVGVVFSVGEDGIEAEGKGLKKIIKRVFEEDDED
ncbi:MAG: hypothetical protein ACI8UO_002966 [Verrucomicrobiales bacterium]